MGGENTAKMRSICRGTNNDNRKNKQKYREKPETFLQAVVPLAFEQAVILGGA
jgi:hypothetical protein